MNNPPLDFDTIQNDVNPHVGQATPGGIISDLLPYIFSIAGIVLLLTLIMGGIQLMTSGGDPKSTQAAKQKITNAIIGIVIFFASFWIVQIVGAVLGISTFSNLFNTPTRLLQL